MKKLLIFIFSVCLIIPCMLLFSACANDPIQYKLSFVVDGEVYAVVDTAGEESISMPQNPTKDGYTFDGWYWDNETWQRPFTSNSLLNEPLSSDMKVYAKWRNDETLRGTQASFASFTKVDDTTYSIVLPNATELLNFSEVVEVNNKTSWKLTTDIYGNNSIASKIATLEPGDNVYYVLVSDEFENVKLYTLNIRRKPLYTVSYYNGFGELHTTQQIEEDSIIETLPTAPEKLGYTFNSWDFDFETKIEEDRSIEATWDLVHYTITYNLDGGTNNDQNPVTYTIEDKVILQKPTKEGYTFYYWQNDDSRVGGITVGTTGDKVFDAVWLKHYNITCHLFGGEINKYNEIRPYYIITDEFYLGSPTKDGYTFDGWYYDENFNNKVNYNYFSNRSGGDVDLYAKFIPIEYKITYELYGGTKHISNPIKYTIEDEILLSFATKDNYDFLGWFSDSGLQNRVIKIEKGTKGDITLYAKFTPTTYTITYELDGGINNDLNPTTYNVEDDIQLLPATKSMYEFLGWFIGDKIIETLNSSCNQNLTLTAKWQSIFNMSDTNLVGITDYGKTLQSITIPSQVTIIEYGVFLKCTSLISVAFEESSQLISIGSSAFSGCSSLTSIIIPDSVTTIGEYAFSGCSSLTSIKIPSSVTSIGNNAFYSCKNLDSFTASGTYTTLDNGNLLMKGTEIIAFAPYGITDYTIPSSVTIIGSFAFSGCSNLTSITIPDSVTIIGSSAFSGCSNLTSITIPDSVTIIGSSAFSGCSSLTSIKIPSSVTSIGNDAFYSCKNLDSFTASGTYTTLDNGNLLMKGTEIIAFAPYGITDYTIPSSVTSIGDYAFYYFSSYTRPYLPYYTFYSSVLTSIIIPSSVTSIGDHAFYLSDITIYCEATSRPSGWNVNSWGNYGDFYWYSKNNPTQEGNYWHYVNGIATKW